jgi:DNA-binding transcriptional ArsR family regulator
MTYRDADGWAALADPTRRAIVMRLAEGERAVGELVAGLPVSQPAVSQHLKVLRDLGLVSDRADGNRRIYRLNPAGVLALRDQLDAFWRRTMAGFADVVSEAGSRPAAGAPDGEGAPAIPSTMAHTDRHKTPEDR